MEWINATFSGFAADLLGYGAVAVIGYGLHWWRTRTLGGQLRTLKKDIEDLRQERFVPEMAKPSTATMQNVSVVIRYPDNTVKGYLDCRIVPPRPEDGSSSAEVHLGRPVSQGGSPLG